MSEETSCFELFISHVAGHKRTVTKLAKRLEERYGISCFVAHEDIEPAKEWRKKIIETLETSDALLAYITDDFHESAWTDQEVGFAYAQETFILPLKIGKTDPKGFMQELQALTRNDSKEIFHTLLRETNHQHLRNQVIRRFANNASPEEVKENFEVVRNYLGGLNEYESNLLVEGFNKNPYNHGAYALIDRDAFLNFINKHSQGGFQKAVGWRSPPTTLHDIARQNTCPQPPYQIQKIEWRGCSR